MIDYVKMTMGKRVTKTLGEDYENEALQDLGEKTMAMESCKIMGRRL